MYSHVTMLPRSMYFVDVDECRHLSNLCENGECINNDGSYRCKCKMGYKLDPTGKKCVGKCYQRHSVN